MGNILKRTWGAAKEIVTNRDGLFGMPKAFAHIYGKDPAAAVGAAVMMGIGAVALSAAVLGAMPAGFAPVAVAAATTTALTSMAVQGRPAGRRGGPGDGYHL